MQRRIFRQLILTGMLFPLALYVQARETAGTVLSPKTLQRWPDPVIIEGRLLKEMLGLPLNHLRLYAFREGGFQPIRYQIDEMDRRKGRISIKLFFGAMTLNLSEGSIKGDTLAYKRGPIRLIRRLEQYIMLPAGIKILRVVADINQYRNIGNCPAIFQVPFRIDRLVSSFTVRFGTDYSPNAIGAKVFNSNNPQGFIIDGHMKQAEHNMNPAFDRWRLLTGDIGTFMTRALPFPEVKKHVKITMGIIDDMEQSYPPEKYPGTIGFFWQDWDLGKAPMGKYILFLEFYWVPNYQPGDEINYLNYQDHPLRVRVDNKQTISQSLIIPALCDPYN